MGMILTNYGGPGNGVFPGDIGPVRVTMRGGAATKGDVLAFDIVAADAAVTSSVPGNSASIWSNVRAPTAAETLGNDPTIFCVALADAADDATLDVQIQGFVDAFVIGAAGSLAVGTDLVVTTAKNFDLAELAAESIVAIGAEVVATPTTRTLGRVFINGLTGMDNTEAA